MQRSYIIKNWKEDSDYLLPVQQKVVACFTTEFPLNHLEEEL